MFKLLVVEDEEIILNKILNNINWNENGFCRVFGASNGVKALEIIKNNNIDLLITDIQMPFMDGIELIRKTKQVKGSTKIIVISGHAEFEYAKESIKLNVDDYILKPFLSKNLLETANKAKDKLIRELKEKKEFKKLRKRLNENLFSLQENFFKDLISNNYIGDIEKTTEYLKLSDINKAPYFVAVLNIKKMELNEEEKYVYNLLLYKWVYSYIKNQADLNNSRVVNFKINQLVLIIYNDSRCVFNALEEMINKVLEEVGFTIHIGVGKQYVHIKDIYASYREACSAANMNYMYGGRAVFMFDDIQFNQTAYSKHLHAIVSNTLYENLKVASYESIKKDVLALISKIKSANLTYEALMVVLNNIILLSCKAVNEIGYSIYDIMGKDFKPYLSPEKLQGNLEEWLLTYFKKINEFINSKRKNRNDLLIQEVKLYIENHFTEDITLCKLAKKYKISTSYLSILFNDKIGKNFSYFISRLRIKKAKELLKHSDLLICEIADKIGYNDAYYFSSSFKKIVGLSPSDYRQNKNALAN